jgi:hypothetical protein
MIGKIIGTYQIIEELGHGPNGRVYQALDQASGQHVALKAISAELARQTTFRQNLRALAQSLTTLQHPRLATLHALQQPGNDLYLVSELINGQSLAQALQQSGVLPPEQAVTLAIQTLTALNHAHKFALVHGGVKPGNLLLTAKDQLKLTDLGLAPALGALNVQEGRGPGVLNYCAPEQIRGATLDARSDIYALGAVLFEMLTGVPPFRRANDAALRKAHLEEAAPSPRNYFPLIPALLEQAILRALAKDPAARFQSAGEFRQALLAWASTPATEVAPVTAPRAPAETAQAGNKPTAPASRIPVPPVLPMPAPIPAAAAQPPKPANEVVVELGEPDGKRGFWKPVAAVAGVGALLGISYAFVRVGSSTATPTPTPAAVQLSPTPVPSSTVAIVAEATVTPAPTATASATPAVEQTPAKTQANTAATALKPPAARPKPAPVIRKPVPAAVAKARPTPTPIAGKKKPYATPTPVATSKKEQKEKKSGGFFKEVFGGGSKEKKQKKP